MKSCLICHNPADIGSICLGCQGLLKEPAHSCRVCAIELIQNEELCGECQKSTPYFSHTQFVCDYGFPADDWVKQLKFANQWSLSKLMAQLMSEKIRGKLVDYKLVPVPLHKNRLRKRGYNQAYEIAKELFKLTGHEIWGVLHRQKSTQMQAQLKFRQRAANVRGAFKVTKEVKERKLLLIDDVMTSGHTLNECARVLIRAGASDVRVFVFARRS